MSMTEFKKSLLQMNELEILSSDGINTSDNAGEVSKAFFVTYNSVDKEVLVFVTHQEMLLSPDDLKSTTRCNRAVVYNIMNNISVFYRFA